MNGQRFMTNVLLSHGYFLIDDPKEQAIVKPYPPLGLLYLSAGLDLHGVENSTPLFPQKRILPTICSPLVQGYWPCMRI